MMGIAQHTKHIAHPKQAVHRMKETATANARRKPSIT